MNKNRIMKHAFIGGCLLMLLCMFSTSTFGQVYEISDAEYFFDTDPGIGLGLQINPNDGNFDQVWEDVSINTSGLSPGSHKIFVRFKDNNGIWSQSFSSAIVVENPLVTRNIKLTQAEVFFDSDPATPMIAIDGNFNDAFERLSKTSLPVPSVGSHTLNMRVRGLDGIWSNTFTTVLIVENNYLSRLVKISQAEFFWDADPGQGAGVPMVAFDFNFNQAFEKVILSEEANVTAGTHLLNIRLRGQGGQWSSTFSSVIEVEDILTSRNSFIQTAEYYIDTDPGEGNGITMISFDGNFNSAFQSVFQNEAINLAFGSHTLNLRYLDNTGIWSTSFTTTLEVEDAIVSRQTRISTAEYFWDNDPGAGNGILMLAFDNNYNDAFERVWSNGLSQVSAGSHILNIRLLSEAGIWSNTISTVITFEDGLIGRQISLISGELFYNADPGEGNGQALISLDGSFDNAFESFQVITNGAFLGSGHHTISFRIIGSDGIWTAPFTLVTYVDPCATSPVVTLNQSGLINLCEGETVTLDASPDMSSYTWYNQETEAGTGISLEVSEAGYYQVVALDAEGCPAISNIVVVAIILVPELEITAQGPTSFCIGGSVNLTASPGFVDYQWSTNQTGSTITVDEAGEYFVNATYTNGCLVVSDTLLVETYTGPVDPVITPSNPIICDGGEIVLSSSYSAGILWSTGETTQEITVGAGTYIVTYTDVTNCSSSSSVIVASEDVLNSISASGYNFYLPDASVDFTSSVVGVIGGYSWNFGDGNTSTQPNPTHLYTTDGLFTVTLTVTSASGCTSVETLAPIQVWLVFPTDDVSLPLSVDATGSTWLSPLVGYVTLPNGQLCYTTDGGLTWIPIVTGTTDNIYGVTYTGDANNYAIWIYGANGLVCVSYNGGPFVSVNPPGLTAGTSFYGGFWYGSYGYYFGSNNTICYYYNGVWYAINPSGSAPGTIWYGGWYAGGYLWAYGSGGQICYYDSGTGLWYPANGTGGISGGTTFYGGYYSSTSSCVFVGGSGGILWGSYNNGFSWGPIFTGYNYTWYDVYVNGSTIICVGQGGAICVSLDGGITWQLYSTGNEFDCTGVEASGCYAYITTQQGGVYQFAIPSGYTNPEISFGGSEQVCLSGPVLVSPASVQVENPRFGSIYQWSTGQFGTQILTNQIGPISVLELNACDTLASDTLFITSAEANVFYADFDGDTFGNPNVIQYSCSLELLNFVSNNLDCNDLDSLSNPSTIELCNGIDDNCDGSIDEGFDDADNDGIADCVDNCSSNSNPLQADWNGDGIGDVCQDFDGDGLQDDLEIANGYNPDNPDTDGDLCGDLAEYLGECEGTCQATFLTDVTQVWLPDAEVIFSSLTIGDITSYLWDFGDGNTSTDPNPAHTYTTPGAYIVTLTVSDGASCTYVAYSISAILVWEIFPCTLQVTGTSSTVWYSSWLSPTVGCATLENGDVLSTTDGGITWINISTGLGIPCYYVNYVGNTYYNAAWIVGYGGNVCVSYNSGPFVVSNPPGTSGINFYGCWFLNPNFGYAFGSGNTVCWYNNGIWVNISPGGVPLGTIWYGSYYYNGALWLVGSGGYICYYLDGVWYPVSSSTTYDLHSIHFFNACGCGYAVGANGTILITLNGGLTWSPCTSGVNYDLNDIYIIDGLNAICVGNYGVVLVTSDGGLSWTLYSIGTNDNCTGITGEGCRAYITTENGGIYQFDIPGLLDEPTIEFSGLDTICVNGNTSLSAANVRVANARPGSTYLWSDGQTGDEIETEDIFIYVTETNICDTLISDTLFIPTTQAIEYYADEDEDGFGDPLNPVYSCESQPIGSVTNDEDCDDTRADVNPNAPGTGEGIDNDCNGNIDTDENYCPADLNNDETVGVSDLLVFLSFYGQICGDPNCTGDFNGDLQVGVSDLLILLSLYGSPCP